MGVHNASVLHPHKTSAAHRRRWVDCCVGGFVAFVAVVVVVSVVGVVGVVVVVVVVGVVVTVVVAVASVVVAASAAAAAVLAASSGLLLFCLRRRVGCCVGIVFVLAAALGETPPDAPGPTAVAAATLITGESQREGL